MTREQKDPCPGNMNWVQVTPKGPVSAPTEAKEQFQNHEFSEVSLFL